MRDTLVSSLARALLQQLGGILIAKGIFTAGEVDLMIGVVLGIVSIVWSILARRRAERDKAAEVQAARAEIPAEVVPTLNKAAETVAAIRETASVVRDLAGRVDAVLPRREAR